MNKSKRKLERKKLVKQFKLKKQKEFMMGKKKPKLSSSANIPTVEIDLPRLYAEIELETPITFSGRNVFRTFRTEEETTLKIDIPHRRFSNNARWLPSDFFIEDYPVESIKNNENDQE